MSKLLRMFFACNKILRFFLGNWGVCDGGCLGACGRGSWNVDNEYITGDCLTLISLGRGACGRSFRGVDNEYITDDCLTLV
ncbi:MAG: hypothetical protein PUK70_06595 [Bacteroidales bacterium]|nr:hypothetical protein [Bacteroidales bacterium]MDY6001800.1 hypothetical protein [Candidatus Cryptobacteroides sp.]